MCNLEIEYQLTLEDEIHSFYLDKEFKAHLPLLHWQNDYWFTLVVLFGFLPTIWRLLNSHNYPMLGFDLLLVLLFVPQIAARFTDRLTNWFGIYLVKKPWRENSYLVKSRKITTTEQELIFCRSKEYLFMEDNECKSYSWDELQFFFFGKKGLMLKFTKERHFFVPLRILNKQQQKEMQDTIEKYGRKLDS